MAYTSIPASVAVIATGKAGGQIIYGGTAAGEDLTLRSTSHATKGEVRFGTSGLVYYDEANDRLQVHGILFGFGGVANIQASTAMGLLSDTVGFYNGNATVTYAVLTKNGSGGRFEMRSRAAYAKGTDAASAAPLALGYGGNLFHITGTTNFAGIVTTDWQAGSQIMLIFDGILTVTHNSGAPGANAAKILFKSGANLTTAANTTVILVYDGTSWYEI